MRKSSLIPLAQFAFLCGCCVELYRATRRAEESHIARLSAEEEVRRQSVALAEARAATGAAQQRTAEVEDLFVPTVHMIGVPHVVRIIFPLITVSCRHPRYRHQHPHLHREQGLVQHQQGQHRQQPRGQRR
jgi:hypothetical protein